MGVNAFNFLLIFTLSNMTFYAFAYLMATVCPSAFIATLMMNLGNGVFVLFSGFLLPFDAVSSRELVGEVAFAAVSFRVSFLFDLGMEA